MKHSLKPWNSFGIQQHANQIISVNNIEKLLEAWKLTSRNGEPTLILGEGSNILFLDDFAGTVILNRIMGIQVIEKVNSWHLHVGAGENWRQLVQFTIENGIAGLENLALIPGCAGSAPIQNIGAYGIELQNVCEYVDCIELNSGKLFRLTTKECQFGYRDSIFKHEYQNQCVIIGIGLRLRKHWTPVLTYGDLIHLDPKIVTPRDVFNVICRIRMRKLPDPKIKGNAGSFFKNPIISDREAKELLEKWPSLPYFHQLDGTVKLAAGWLIDQCQLKGTTKGGAAIYQDQVMVLINQNHATSKDIVQLARFIRKSVGEKFNIWLEPEVRFIGCRGEINAVEAIS